MSDSDNDISWSESDDKDISSAVNNRVYAIEEDIQKDIKDAIILNDMLEVESDLAAAEDIMEECDTPVEDYEEEEKVIKEEKNKKRITVKDESKPATKKRRVIKLNETQQVFIHKCDAPSCTYTTASATGLAIHQSKIHGIKGKKNRSKHNPNRNREYKKRNDDKAYKLTTQPLEYLKDIIRQRKRNAHYKNIPWEVSEDYLVQLMIDADWKHDNITLTHIRGDGIINTNASLDRIDSFVGYTPGNVQWTSYRFNILKMNADNTQFLNSDKWKTAKGHGYFEQ